MMKRDLVLLKLDQDVKGVKEHGKSFFRNVLSSIYVYMYRFIYVYVIEHIQIDK
jgi:hypothetical protein